MRCDRGEEKPHRKSQRLVLGQRGRQASPRSSEEGEDIPGCELGPRGSRGTAWRRSATHAASFFPLRGLRHTAGPVSSATRGTQEGALFFPNWP